MKYCRAISILSLIFVSFGAAAQSNQVMTGEIATKAFATTQINLGDNFPKSLGRYDFIEGQVFKKEPILAEESDDSVSIDFAGDGFVSYKLDKATIQKLNKDNENGLVKLVNGKISMSEKMANDIMTSVINNDGRIEADSMIVENGVVKLVRTKAFNK